MTTPFFMINRQTMATAAVCMLLLTACVTDTIYNTDHPEQARVTVVTEWSDRGADVAKPDSYNIKAPGVSETAAAESYTVRTLLDPGKQTFTLYNNADGIILDGSLATVRAVSGGGIDPMPGWLFTGTATAILEKDSETTVNVAMHQQVRQLTLIVEPEGDAADDITAISAGLSGVAGGWNIETGAPAADAVSTVPLFTKLADGTWSATVRLLGVSGAQQVLAGTLNVAGKEEEVPLESDLSGSLNGFNDNKTTPLTLRGKIVVEPDPAPEPHPVEAGFTATIKEWVTVGGGNGTAW